MKLAAVADTPKEAEIDSTRTQIVKYAFTGTLVFIGSYNRILTVCGAFFGHMIPYNIMPKVTGMKGAILALGALGGAAVFLPSWMPPVVAGALIDFIVREIAADFHPS